jgi:hypothetical protein
MHGPVEEIVMSDFSKTVTDLFHLGGKIAQVYTQRILDAQSAFLSSVQSAAETVTAQLADPWQAWSSYAIDSWQRCALFWDTLRQRGKPPLLDFDYETVVDGANHLAGRSHGR